MNTNKKLNRKSTKTRNGSIAKGALVWGAVYSTASSGAAYMLAPVMTGSSMAFSDIFMDSLLIFPTAGAARGLILWRLNQDRRKGHKHPWRVHKHNKAA